MHRRMIPSILIALLGCGTAIDDDVPPGANCETAADVGSVGISGMMYWDGDQSDESRHAHSFNAEVDSGLAGQKITLLGADGTSSTNSCADGTFAFEAPNEGPYVLDVAHPDDAECMQRNCTKRFPRAIEEGAVTVLTFGDSVPKIGDPPMFPSRLATLIGELAEVDNRNVAVPGSLSTQWVPGTSYFDNKVMPNVAEADVIIISVGGNDITNSLDASALQNIDQAIADTFQLVTEIVENIRDMATEIRAINSDVDIVYCLYVDYGTATINPWGLASLFLPEDTITNILVSAREQVPSDENIILADLFGASQKLEEPLDNYLYDALHFNDKGQTMYAQEVFQSLGGVLVGPSPIGGSPTTPLNLNPKYSYSQ